MGILIGNGAKNEIFSKKHFLMEFWQIRDHFLIVMWQKNIYCKVVSEIDFCGRKCHFWHTQNFGNLMILM